MCALFSACHLSEGGETEKNEVVGVEEVASTEVSVAYAHLTPHTTQHAPHTTHYDRHHHYHTHTHR